MFVIGYKALNSDMTNRYGDKYVIGKTYHAEGELRLGNLGNGFHLCTNLEDCFRYVKADDCLITEVIGFGKLLEYNDEYYGYYNMYVAEYMRIIRVISRDEIISTAKLLSDDRLVRLIQTYPMSDEEVEEVSTHAKGKTKVLKAIQYYHYNDKDVYRRKENG